MSENNHESDFFTENLGWDADLMFRKCPIHIYTKSDIQAVG